MTLNLDTSTPIRTLLRYRELVTAILEASASTPETAWVEWKSEADVSEKRWAAELSRQVLGFANCDPEAAGRWFGGCAYTLVGVSPGAVTGTRVHDTARIEDWMTPYFEAPFSKAYQSPFGSTSFGVATPSIRHR